MQAIDSALVHGKIVPGGGAPEIRAAMELRKYADTFKGREQLAVAAFAEAMEVVPRSLAENAGLDTIDKLANLRSMHDKSNTNVGLNVFNGNVDDMLKTGVVEPLKIKLQAIQSAGEAAEMILRIDDMISAGGSGGKGGPPMSPGGMPPGMGEY